MRVSSASMAASDPLLQSAHDAIGDWTRRAIASGWLADTAQQQLNDLVTATPAELFDTRERPLVVGLFGGTGVGKSTLLNRMAGQEIARASAERPTSRTVTAYLHRSQHLDRLPEDFPMQRLATSLHHQERWHDVLWLDMPDVDSVAAEHRELVLQWLPYIDLLIYVVSPERYRDASAWTLLREHGGDHAWHFVFNQRDRGSTQQLEDFRTLLASAGFHDPAVFATASPLGQRTLEDDLQALLGSIESLSERKVIEELARRGVTERLNKVFATAYSMASPALENDPARRTLQDRWTTYWAPQSAAMKSSLRARSAQLARHATAAQAPDALAEQLIDSAAAARLDAAIGSFLQDLDSTGDLPRKASTIGLASWRGSAVARVRTDTAQGLAEEIAHPGSPMRRLAIRWLGAAATGLPTLALLWVSWRVFNAFRTAATDAAAYLDINFAVTAVLLILVSWALPWWLARRLTPGDEVVIQRGLQAGAEKSLEQWGRQMSEHLSRLEVERQGLAADLDEIRAQFPSVAAPGTTRSSATPSQPLQGLISTRPLDVSR